MTAVVEYVTVEVQPEVAPTYSGNYPATQDNAEDKDTEPLYSLQ